QRLAGGGERRVGEETDERVEGGGSALVPLLGAGAENLEGRRRRRRRQLAQLLPQVRAAKLRRAQRRDDPRPTRGAQLVGRRLLRAWTRFHPSIVARPKGSPSG